MKLPREIGFVLPRRDEPVGPHGRVDLKGGFVVLAEAARESEKVN